MAEATLERVAEEVKSLTPEEQQQLRRLLDSWLAESPQQSDAADDLKAKEELLTQRLLEKGILRKLPTGERLHQQFQPIPVIGRPVSETLLEDRR